ncbi:MAG: hypothetical protein HFH89_09690, partial [Lachnospiraceae bacterium]|nr:hypothetical protein [Lachnospiraceae bacterium]
IGYPWADLLDMDSITLHDAHILAKCVREMTDRELKVFGAVLEIEAPKAVTLTRDYGIEVEFSVSEAQYLGGMEMG